MSQLKSYIDNTYKDLKLYNSFWMLNQNSMPLDVKFDINGFIREDKKFTNKISMYTIYVMMNG